ncbi:MAG: gluconate 2-dehydrogenase subunit 3 family protein [Armatimonadota bacterium]
MRISRDELNGYMENWDEQTRALLQERMTHRYQRERLEHFTEKEARTLRAMLDRLIPQTDEGLDLVGFVDWALGKPLGRGDRRRGMPGEADLFHRGLAGVEETARARYGKALSDLTAVEQDAVLTALQTGTAEETTWQDLPASQFFTKLLTKALTGYCAHPLAWMRMGFPGPSYPEGYTWITPWEVLARRRHVAGWKTL